MILAAVSGFIILAAPSSPSLLLPAPLPPPCSSSSSLLLSLLPAPTLYRFSLCILHVRVPREILNYFILFSLIVCIDDDDDDADVRGGDSSDDEDVWEVPVVFVECVCICVVCCRCVPNVSLCVTCTELSCQS
ncbi:unnamed protein product [Arctogadus glacialis]